MSVYDMPTEMLVGIFEHGGLISLHEGGLPFVVKASHVSSQWRNVALGTPSVWSAIPVHPLRPALTNHYLKRSANLPLDVYLHFKKQLNAKEALSLLLEHRLRWRNLYLDAGNGGAVFLVVSSLKDAGRSLPILRHFEVTFTGKPGTIGMLPEVFDNSSPPRLHSLSMRGVSFNVRSPIFQTATHLDLSFLPRDMGTPTFSSFSLLLGGLKHLTHLKLASVFPKLLEGVDYGSIELPALHTLELVMHKEEDYVPLFFSILCAPALHTFRFESRWDTTWNGFLAHMDILSAQFPLVQNMSLTMATPIVPDTSITIYPGLFMGFSELRILSLTTFQDDLVMRYFLWPWLFICDAADQHALDDYSELGSYDWTEVTVWPKLELLVVRAPFDGPITAEHDDQPEPDLDDALELLGSLRLSYGQNFDISQRPVFADYIPDALDVE